MIPSLMGWAAISKTKRDAIVVGMVGADGIAGVGQAAAGCEVGAGSDGGRCEHGADSPQSIYP